MDGEAELDGDSLPLGLTLGDSLDEGLVLLDGETEGDSDELGD